MTLNQLDRQVAHRLTQYYILALTLVAILTVSGLWFVKRTLRDLDDDGRVVNVAGRQRMLSQRLTKLAVLQTQSIPHADRGDFGKLLTLWYESHEQLRNGMLRMEKEYVVRKSPQLDAMFNQVQAVFGVMYQNLRIIHSEQARATDKAAALQVVLDKEPRFLNQMDAIVFQFDAESLKRLQYLERIEWLLTLATLTVLFLEGVLVFRPVVNHTKHVIRRLTQSEDVLKNTNEKLALANKELLETQQKLIHTTQEKYQLQLAEETVRSAALLEGQEEERRRFARELHDGIGQMLTGLKLHVEKLRKMPFADEKQKRRIEDLRDLLQATIQNTREVAFNLMPSVLSDFGLEAALQLLSDQMARSSGIDIRYTGKKESERLAPAQEIGLYRVAQEALNNAVKHAHATRIDVAFERRSDVISLRVVDDGRGFSKDTDEPRLGSSLVHNGIGNMKTRVRLLHGTLNIHSNTNQGSKIEVNILV
jgi:signal transduction histidine kinase